jgi:Ni,Fe-hydrogenase I large subunit
MHEITLDGDVVADYVIVAPTEWNFHPAGPLSAWLSGLPAAAARELASRAVLALDPCVPWELEIVEH